VDMLRNCETRGHGQDYGSDDQMCFHNDSLNIR
jgi:hypothetical protein